jgi:hypothetical protein
MNGRVWHIGTRFESWDVIDRGRATKAERQAALSKVKAVQAMRSVVDGDQAVQILLELHAGTLGHLIPRALAPRHVRGEFLHLVENGRVLVIPRRPSEGAEADVVVITDDHRSELDDTSMVAKLLHGDQATMRVVSSPGELIAYLKSMRFIRRLVLMTHGAPGEIMVGGTPKDLSWYAQELEGPYLRCTEIFFEGCHVGAGGPQVVAFMNAVRADRATGYAAFHAWGCFGLPTVRGETADQVSQKLRPYERFLIKGQANAVEDLARRPGKHRLAYEFFSRQYVDARLLNDPSQRYSAERLFTRAMMVDESRSIGDAKAAQLAHDLPIGDMVTITFIR